MRVITNIVNFSKLYKYNVIILITIIILQFMEFYINIYYLQLIYFIIAAFCLVYSLSLITSTLSTIIRDVHMFLNSTLRMMLYLSGVLWPLSNLTANFPAIAQLMKLNPLF